MLKDFDSWAEYMSYVESMGETGDELCQYADFQELFAQPDFLSQLNSMQSVITNDPKSADVLLTTTHQAKGLEWENVVVASDFVDLNKMVEFEICTSLQMLITWKYTDDD